ncbi:hypothetical protein BV898_17193 [Hypsibius exemplaris]|uniref:Insulin-like growth factor-binding protein complex acid labile subunit n=1 Tax=Hypsibius exemplaris TaxID=2072580 RepID=A0A9X6NF46_HYPEX|nr:hypothetical protein BV898_17193 [Hypsibius exemplaris]
MKIFQLRSFTLIFCLIIPIEGKCSRLPSGNCWVNCMEKIFDVICNSVTATMVRSDIAVFAGTAQEFRLYIWSSPSITRLSADMFQSVAKQILTLDLQDLINLSTFPEVYTLVNLHRFSVWNSPKLLTLSLELLPPSLYRIALNKIGLTHFTNNFADVLEMPNLQEFVLRNLTIKGWQNDFLNVFPQLSLLEISNSTINLAKEDIFKKEQDSRASSRLEKLGTLATLKLYHNNASKVASHAFFGALLESLIVPTGGEVDLSRNGMAIPSRVFRGGQLSAAVRINMRGNLLEGATGMFASFTQLTELDVSWTNLSPIRGTFSGLPALRTLKLHHNNLQNLWQVDIFDGSASVNLTHLDLSYNDLTILPAPNSSLSRIVSQVTYLNLAGNQLQFYFSNSSGQFGNPHTGIAAFVSLETLILSHNRLTVFQGVHLAPLTKLKVLDISCNPLKFLNKETFMDLPPSLFDVDVSMCIHSPQLPPWIDQDAFTTMPPIKILRMQAGVYKKSVFATLRFSPETTESLEELYFDDNAITTLLIDTIPRLPNLRTLGLSRNMLQSVSAGLFANLPSLRRLDLKGNLIGSLADEFALKSSQQLQQLEDLDLSDNGMRQIAPGAFDGLPSLKVQPLMSEAGVLRAAAATPLDPPDIYNLVLANPDDRLNRRDEHLISLLQVCEVGPDVPDHETYPGLKQYVGVTIHDTDEGDGVSVPDADGLFTLELLPGG